jgi:hypothetical protein
VSAPDTGNSSGLLWRGIHLCRTLQHPIAVTALVVLVFNDHWLKQHHPSWLSGKLSDVAGLVLLPLWLEVVLRLGGAPERPERVRALAVLCSLVVFSAMQLLDSVNVAYSWGLAAAQWPARALWSLLSDTPQPALRPVTSFADPEDLLTLPALWLTRWVPIVSDVCTEPVAHAHGDGDRKTRNQSTFRHGLILCIFGCGLAWTSRASAASKACDMDGYRETPRAYCHDGFFLEASVNTAWVWVNSERSISNEFAQAIPASAFGVSSPSIAWHIGGSPKPGLVIGGRVSTFILRGAELETLGQNLYLPNLELVYVDFGPFVMYYLDPGAGTFVRGSVNLGGITTNDGENEDSSQVNGHKQRPIGPSIVVGAGHGIWLHPQWTLALAIELHYFRSFGSNQSSLFAPNIALQVAWH